VVQRTKKAYKFLLSHQPGLEMENVIFHGISFIIFVYLLAMSTFNFIYEQDFLGIFLLGASVVLIAIYINSRFLGHFMSSYLMFGLLCYPIIALNFYLNDGIEGPSSYVLLMFHLIMMTLSPKKHYVFWIVYNFLIFSVLISIDIFHPQLIPSVYLSVEHQFGDHLITYMVSLIGIVAVISTIKRYYRLEKWESEAKSRELLEVNHRLQRSNEQKNKIIALISHDLRSPLNSILSILEFMQAGELDEDEREVVQNELLTMTSNTKRMLDNILEWASSEIQEKEIHITQSDIKSACENVLAIYEILASNKNIRFITKYKDNPVIKTDMGRVILIVRNLVQNAIKFTPKGGEISFVVQQLGDEVQISISDTGIGFSKENLENVFLLDIKPTYGTEKEKGTGLGLYLSRESAKKINADISIQSEEGRGSTFTLTLPLALETRSHSVPFN